MAKEKLTEIVERLQKENEGKIVLIRIGIFFCGIGKDAVMLEKLLKYQPVCFKAEICKVGIPVNAFKQVIPKLIETGYSYVIYDYNKDERKERKILELAGAEIYEEKQNIECNKCWYYKNKKKSTEEYMQELEKMIRNKDNE